jgi:hypothetical protein
MFNWNSARFVEGSEIEPGVGRIRAELWNEGYVESRGVDSGTEFVGFFVGGGRAGVGARVDVLPMMVSYDWDGRRGGRGRMEAVVYGCRTCSAGRFLVCGEGEQGAKELPGSGVFVRPFHPPAG